MTERLTVPKLQQMKVRNEPIVCVTAYDSGSVEIAEAAGVDLILVGDSVGNTMLGHASTLPVDLADMVLFTKAAASRNQKAVLVADLPFGSYQASPAQAVESSVQLMKAGATAVKLEGDYAEAVVAVTRAGIPCMGHIGMTPQSLHALGGHRVQGKGEQADHVMKQAIALEGAGVFSIVLELVEHEVAEKITKRCQVPTIGIGSGPNCDGQIQVYHDVLGLSERKFKHAERYVEGRTIFTEALQAYAKDVKTNRFKKDD